ncbi:DUF481 domain-containing protein [Thalassotalea sp. LPB0316]|uniref:DUF481 domain-containing protein n=1 Tax=Thalassotalea sp. LPB0316 TaxID=2769490 RepID=UPI00186672DF|nr:DUF481 domain-containing protein [Thalassotalea sp. LPB0316]QOL25943.1 DUF481 domain-containing protein [Thalassotalea sp. LPB0316]
MATSLTPVWASEILDEERALVALAKTDPIFDWVRLTSGEWLKGEIEGYYEDEMAFDSDVLGKLTLDNDDIHSVISARVHSLKLRDGSVIKAPIEIIDRRGSLFGNPDAFTFYEVLTIASDKEAGLDIWDIKVNVGFSLSSGNIDRSEWTARLNGKRRTVDSRLILDYFNTRAETDKIETENNTSLSATYDIFYTEKLFFRPVLLNAVKDPFKNLKKEYTIGAGVGYYLIDTRKTEWDVSIGPSYRTTYYVNVQEGASNKEKSFGGFLETHYQHEINKDLDIKASYNVNYGDKESGGLRHELFLTFEYDLFENIDLDLSFIWDRQSNPQADDANNTPEKNDYKTFISLGIEL